MRIAWILPGGVDRGGEVRVIPAVLWLLERLAHVATVHVVALRQEDRTTRYSLLGATVHAVGRPARRARALRTILREHGSEPFDLVYATGGLDASAVAVIAASFLRIPSVIHLTGGELVIEERIGYGGRRSWRGRAWSRLVLGGADRIVGLSEPLVSQVEGLGHRALRVPLGVDESAWPPRRPRARDPARPARLIHVASLNRVKDQPTLLRAAALLRDQGISFRLDLVGQDTLRGEVHGLARRLGLDPLVSFHGFQVQKRVRAFMDAADLLLMSSVHEGGPVVLMEAALRGIPAVGTDVGLFREWAPEAALTVPRGDSTSMAAAVRSLLEDDGRRTSIARAAQRRAREENADFTAERIMEVFREVTDVPGIGR